MFVAGLLLLGYQYFYGRQHFRFHTSHIYLYSQVIVFGILISYFLRFWALEYITATKLLFLYNLAPFMSALHSYFFLSERMSSRKWVGMLIGFVGLLPIFLNSTAQEKSLGDFFYFISWPELAVIVSVATNSYSWIVMRKLVRDEQYSPMMINGICMTLGGLLALIIALPLEGPCLVTDVWAFIGWLTFIIVISNIVSHNLYGYLLRDYTATFLSFAGFMSPLFAGLYGWLFFHETITWHFYASSIIVFIGLFLFYQDEIQDQESVLQ